MSPFREGIPRKGNRTEIGKWSKDLHVMEERETIASSPEGVEGFQGGENRGKSLYTVIGDIEYFEMSETLERFQTIDAVLT